MFPEDGVIWSNGQLIPWKQAQVHVMTHGLHYGSGIFEGLRTYDSAQGPLVFQREDHLRRFYDSAKAYCFQMPYSLEALKEATLAVIRANQLKDCYIRPIAFVGYGKLGVLPDREKIEVHIGCWPINASILAGITRDTILQLARDLGYTVEIGALTVGQLMTADEAFFTETAAEVTPIREVDGREIGSHGHWPITRHLQKTYFRVVKGLEPRYRHWLTPVYK